MTFSWVVEIYPLHFHDHGHLTFTVATFPLGIRNFSFSL